MSYTPGTEVATLPQGSQFEGGESAYLCVFFGVSDIAASSPPNSAVGQSWEWVDQTADRLAQEVQGNNAEVTSKGASLQDEYDALSKLHLSYTSIPTNSAPGDGVTAAAIRKEIEYGRPVLLCAAEPSFIDEATGKVDYHWTPTGNHCIVVTGYDSNHNYIVRDYAAVGNNFVPGSKRTYLASKVEAVSATAVNPYWKPAATNGIPDGWEDDGTTLKAPNGNVMVAGFRKYVLEHNWNKDNQPTRHEQNVPSVLLHNQSVGAGSRQPTRDGLFWWTQKDGVVYEPYLGLEIDAAYNLIDALQKQGSGPIAAPVIVLVDKLNQAVSGMLKSLTAPQTAPAGGEPVVPALVQFLNSAEAALTEFEHSTNITPPPPAL